MQGIIWIPEETKKKKNQQRKLLFKLRNNIVGKK